MIVKKMNNGELEFIAKNENEYSILQVLANALASANLIPTELKMSKKKIVKKKPVKKLVKRTKKLTKKQLKIAEEAKKIIEANSFQNLFFQKGELNESNKKKKKTIINKKTKSNIKSSKTSI